MPMRTDCRHYESRTYPSGETVRKCRLDLAPDAPWRCPDDCPKFEKRRWDAGWQYGSLGESAKPSEAEPQGKEVDALLDEAEDIVNLAAPDILSEFEKKSRKRRDVGELPRSRGQRVLHRSARAAGALTPTAGRRCERRDSNPQAPKGTGS